MSSRFPIGVAHKYSVPLQLPSMPPVLISSIILLTPIHILQAEMISGF